jgi:hypothetical protein
MGTNVEEDVVAEGSEGTLHEEVETTNLQEHPTSTPHSTLSSSSALRVRRGPSCGGSISQDGGELSQATFLCIADIDHQYGYERLEVYPSLVLKS